MKKLLLLSLILMISNSVLADDSKCLKNTHIVGDRVTGDWVCAPPRAATPEEEKSLTET